MKGLMEICFDWQEYENEGYFVDGTLNTTYDYKLSVNTYKDISYEEILKNKDRLLQDTKDNKDLLFLPSKVQQAMDQNYDFFDHIEYILIGNNLEEFVAYVQKNPEVKTKKLLLPSTYLGGVFTLDQENYREILDKVKDIEDLDLYVQTSGNEDIISLQEYKRTIDKIDAYVAHIKSYNYSPLEALMHVYDLVRDHVYQKEDATEKPTASRDITKILFSDKRVCVGFANLFNEIVRKLGFKATVYRLIGEKSGHINNLVYVKDKKYGMDGLYYFDCTNGCQKKEWGISHFLSYRYFVRTKQQMDSLYKNKYEDDQIRTSLDEIMDNLLCDHPFNLKDKNMRRTINFLSKFIEGKVLLSFPEVLYDENSINKEELFSHIYTYSELLNRPIAADVLLKALSVVRKNEYYESPEKYPYDFNTFYQTLWFSQFPLTLTHMDQLLFFINQKPCKPFTLSQAKQKVLQLDEQEQIKKEIEQTKVAKVLQKVYQQKTNQK